MKTNLLALVALALPFTMLACTQPTAAEDEGASSSNQDIVGGTVAPAGAWQGPAALYVGAQHICGGSLIAPGWVLTAGHCIIRPTQTNGGIDSVVVGRLNLAQGGGEKINVKKAFRHPQWNGSTLDNDLALLQLVRNATSATVTVATASQARQVDDGATVTVIGWGTTSEGGEQSDALRQVSVPVIGNDRCAGFSGYEDVTQNMICAAEDNGGKDSCQGDSGGPLFIKSGSKQVQVGIVSWGLGCAQAGAPGVYTRLGNYLSWLSTTTNGAFHTR